VGGISGVIIRGSHGETMGGDLEMKEEKMEFAGEKIFFGGKSDRLDALLWEIDRSELKMFELLGKGFFGNVTIKFSLRFVGEVRRAIWNGTEVAVKEIYK
jgi:hypothetical protein